MQDGTGLTLVTLVKNDRYDLRVLDQCKYTAVLYLIVYTTSPLALSASLALRLTRTYKHKLLRYGMHAWHAPYSSLRLCPCRGARQGGRALLQQDGLFMDFSHRAQ
mgnify:CR=1 FL=1